MDPVSKEYSVSPATLPAKKATDAVQSKSPLSSGRFSKLANSVASIASVVKTVDESRIYRLENPAAIMHISNPQIRREHWGLFLHSKEFQEMMDEVFASACHLIPGNKNYEDNELDASELQVAMEILHDKLSQVAATKLPKCKETALSLINKFDIDNSGKLNLDEFRRFSQVYFNRLNWPLWFIAARGCGYGVFTFLATKLVVVPTVRPVAIKVAKLILPKIRILVKKLILDTIGVGFRTIGFAIHPSRIRNRPSKEAAVLLRLKAERAKRIKKRINFGKNLGVTSVIGALAACAGLI